MKKSICKLIIISLLFSLLFVNFSYGNLDITHGTEDGESVGIFIGELYGKNDYNNNRTNSWQRAIPTEKQIIEMFNLSRETATYRSTFIRFFRTSFEEGYKRAYRDSNVALALEEADNTGLEDGMTIGRILGDISGRRDFSEGKSSNWSRVIPSDQEIIRSYNLNRDSAVYRDGFIKGFKKSFQAYYIMGFRDANISDIIDGLVAIEDKLDYKNISILGGALTSEDNIMTMEFEKGSFYRDTNLAFLVTDLRGIDPSYQLTPLTHLYEVYVEGTAIFPQKPMKLSFRYYGPESGGIYVFNEDGWVYLPSEYDGEYIYTYINTPLYRGGKYAVLINGNHREINDIRGHWAYKEIDYFNRNNLFTTNNVKFDPDKLMTRGEFILLLDKYYKWSNNHISDLSKYKDSSILGDYKNSFSKGIALGYISGYSDNTLRPNMPISYQEVEWIMQKVLNNKSFQWKSTGEVIRDERGYSSLGLVNKRLFITRAEAVYLLYSIN